MTKLTPEAWSACQAGPMTGPAMEFLTLAGFEFEPTKPSARLRHLSVNIYHKNGAGRRLVKTVRTVEAFADWSSGARDMAHALGVSLYTLKENRA